jgi:nitroimidazol reductase NimA-like FMN-containing flavoprotein (pyridoxamine 5'-phosphate oxidase superfamily)
MTDPVGERPHMPDYGVADDAGWEPLPWAWAAARLGPARNYWVVTVSGDGRPHALPVWGVWDDAEHRFCFSCGPRSRKAGNLSANPAVAFAPEDTVECVSVEGRGLEVADEQRRERWIERYLDKYRPLAPDLTPAFLRQNLVFEVTPERAFAIIEREGEFSGRATRWRFA